MQFKVLNICCCLIFFGFGSCCYSFDDSDGDMLRSWPEFRGKHRRYSEISNYPIENRPLNISSILQGTPKSHDTKDNILLKRDNSKKRYVDNEYLLSIACSFIANNHENEDIIPMSIICYEESILESALFGNKDKYTLYKLFEGEAEHESSSESLSSSSSDSSSYDNVVIKKTTIFGTFIPLKNATTFRNIYGSILDKELNIDDDVEYNVFMNGNFDYIMDQNDWKIMRNKYK